MQKKVIIKDKHTKDNLLNVKLFEKVAIIVFFLFLHVLLMKKALTESFCIHTKGAKPEQDWSFSCISLKKFSWVVAFQLKSF